MAVGRKTPGRQKVRRQSCTPGFGCRFVVCCRSEALAVPAGFDQIGEPRFRAGSAMLIGIGGEGQVRDHCLRRRNDGPGFAQATRDRSERLRDGMPRLCWWRRVCTVLPLRSCMAHPPAARTASAAGSEVKARQAFGVRHSDAVSVAVDALREAGFHATRPHDVLSAALERKCPARRCHGASVLAAGERPFHVVHTFVPACHDGQVHLSRIRK